MDDAVIERVVRRGTLYARVALFMLVGLGGLLVGLIAWQGQSAAATAGGAIGLVLGAVPLWGPLVLHVRRMAVTVRAAATAGDALTGRVVDGFTISVRGNPVTRIRFDVAASDGQRFRGAHDLPGHLVVEPGAAVAVRLHGVHRSYCLVATGPAPEDLAPARLLPLEGASRTSAALRIALAVLLLSGLVVGLFAVFGPR